MVQTCDLARLRSDNYLLMADLYLPPTADTMADALELANRLDQVDTPVEDLAFYPALNGLLARTLALARIPLESVRGLYGGAVPLLESEYMVDLNPEELGMFESALESGYENIGLDLSSTLRIDPDHAGAECLYLGLLARLEADAWESEDFASLTRTLQVEVTFLRDHPCQWFPDLAWLHARRMPDSYLSDVSRAAHELAVHDVGLLNALSDRIAQSAVTGWPDSSR